MEQRSRNLKDTIMGIRIALLDTLMIAHEPLTKDDLTEVTAQTTYLANLSAMHTELNMIGEKYFVVWYVIFPNEGGDEIWCPSACILEDLTERNAAIVMRRDSGTISWHAVHTDTGDIIYVADRLII
jgi:hypothetical protein